MSKPFAKLNRADFLNTPIWEWVPDDGSSSEDGAADESHVQATDLTEIPLLPFGQFIVASVVDLNSGASMPGFAEVTVANGDVVVQPDVVFLLDRQLRIPGVETNRLLSRFTKTAENYPVAWRLGVSIQGEGIPRAGQIKSGDMTEMVRAGINALLALKALRK
jgi:hypothetical protein